MDVPPAKRKKEAEPSSQYARCNDGQQQSDMPPPPRRYQDVVPDSQFTEINADTTVETRSVGNARGAPSLQDSSVPAGFFEDTAQRPMTKNGTSQNKQNGEFDAFMQEISALGAVKNNQDGTIMEVSEQPEKHEGDDSVHNSGEDDIDAFEQFVRKERMREIREAVQQRNSAVFEQSGNSVLAEVSGVASDNFISVPTISLPPERKSIAESYKEILQHASDEASSSSDDDDDDDWRRKKLR